MSVAVHTTRCSGLCWGNSSLWGFIKDLTELPSLVCLLYCFPKAVGYITAEILQPRMWFSRFLTDLASVLVEAQITPELA